MSLSSRFLIVMFVRAVPSLLLAICLSACAENFVSAQAGEIFKDQARAYAADDDPELVWSATPFALKMLDGFLLRTPRDQKLLLSAVTGYTQYAYGSLVQEADMIERHDHARATELRLRARKLFSRARDYGLRSLELSMPGFVNKLRSDPAGALVPAKPTDVPCLYWTACAWGSAISLGKEDPELTADLYVVEAIMRRVLELDATYDEGAPHEFMIAYEGARNGNGGTFEKAAEHYRSAVELSKGRRVSVHVTFAESVLLPGQKRAEFEKMLETAVGVSALQIHDELRLANTIYQRRARWLLEKVDELFLEP